MTATEVRGLAKGFRRRESGERVRGQSSSTDLTGKKYTVQRRQKMIHRLRETIAIRCGIGGVSHMSLTTIVDRLKIHICFFEKISLNRDVHYSGS